MLKLKLQYFGHLMWRVDSLEKTLMLGGMGGRGREWDNRGWDGWMASRIQWMWELDHKEGWASKIDAFELWCWRRLLSVFWTARKSNQSVLKEISPEYSLENQSWNNTLATWYKGRTCWKRTWCWERLRAGGEGGDRGWDDWMASPTRWTWVWVSSGSWWWTGRPGVLQFMGCKESDTTERLNWTELYSRWYSAQCYVAAWMRGEFRGEWIHVYIWPSPFSVHLKLSQCC